MGEQGGTTVTRTEGTPASPATVKVEAIGNGQKSLALVKGLMWILGIDLVAVALLGASTQFASTQNWQLVAKVIEGQLTLATVLASGLVGMARGTSN